MERIKTGVDQAPHERSRQKRISGLKTQVRIRTIVTSTALAALTVFLVSEIIDISQPPVNDRPVSSDTPNPRTPISPKEVSKAKIIAGQEAFLKKWATDILKDRDEVRLNDLLIQRTSAPRFDIYMYYGEDCIVFCGELMSSESR